MSPVSRRLLLPGLVLVIGLVLIGAASWVTFAGREPGAPAASAIGGPFQMTSQENRPVSEADFKGGPTLIFFGYTHCPDVCPTTLFEISELLRKMGPDKNVRALFVTVDPERDTPAIMKDYVSSFDKRIVGLTGDRASVDAMLKTYRVYSKKIPGTGDDYGMDHSAIVYLMDRQMRFVNALNLQQPEQAAREIGKYL
jgi:protein SCO1/2